MSSFSWSLFNGRCTYLLRNHKKRIIWLEMVWRETCCTRERFYQIERIKSRQTRQVAVEGRTMVDSNRIDCLCSGREQWWLCMKSDARLFVFAYKLCVWFACMNHSKCHGSWHVDDMVSDKERCAHLSI